MKVLFAPGAFKNALSAEKACGKMAEAVAKEWDWETVSVPVANGGEGTMEALVTAAGGEIKTCRVTGPCYDKVEASYGLIRGGQTAVIELAQASGLHLAPVSRLDPMRATSRGTGELIRQALDLGVRDIVIGVGGSAANDGGMGLLHALGVRFYDDRGDVVPDCGRGLEQVAQIDLGGLDARLKNTSIRVICDSSSPLLGSQGATYTEGPRRGAWGMALQALEAGMTHYAERFKAKGIDIADFPGAGAGGGAAGVLKGVLDGEILSGADAVLEAVGFDQLLQGVDLVFTGEWLLEDHKVSAGVARHCREQDIPIIAFVGAMGDGSEPFLAWERAAVMPLANAPMAPEEVLAHAPELLKDAVKRAVRLMRLGGLKG